MRNYEEIGRAVAEVYRIIYDFVKRLCHIKNSELRTGIFILATGGFKDISISDKKWREIEDWLDRLCTTGGT